jgi:hypothetical protein
MRDVAEHRAWTFPDLSCPNKDATALLARMFCGRCFSPARGTLSRKQ